MYIWHCPLRDLNWNKKKKNCINRNRSCQNISGSVCECSMEMFEFYITIQTSINHSQCYPVVVYYQKNDDTCIVWLVYGV